MQESSSGKEGFCNPEYDHFKESTGGDAAPNIDTLTPSSERRKSQFNCEESKVSFIRVTCLEEAEKEQRITESFVNISYDDQRFDLTNLQRSEQRRLQRHKSSLRLPLSYQEVCGAPDLLLRILSAVFLFYGIIVGLSVIMLILSIWL